MGGLAFFASFDLSSFFSSLASSLSSFFSWCYIDQVKLACIVSAHLRSLSSGVQTKGPCLLPSSQRSCPELSKLVWTKCKACSVQCCTKQFGNYYYDVPTAHGSPLVHLCLVGSMTYDFAVSVSLSYQATANSQAPLFCSGVSSAPNGGLEDQVYDVYKWFLLIF